MNNKNLLPLIIAGVMLMFIITGCGSSGSDKVYVNTQEPPSVSREINDKSSEVSGNKKDKESEGVYPADDGYVYVQVCGAVNQPGVYKVSSTLRVFEVIDMAGGVTEEADTNVINMAKPVMDEMKLYIPAKDEVSAGNYDNSGYDLYSEEPEDTDSEEEDGLVNINEAGEEELMTLPGIGEAKAGAIIAYREENGAFTDISEIMNISGIKQAAFDKIKDLIKV